MDATTRFRNFLKTIPCPTLIPYPCFRNGIRSKNCTLPGLPTVQFLMAWGMWKWRERPGRSSLIKNTSLRPYLVVSAPPTGVLNIQSETPPPTYVDTDIIHMMKWARQWRINVCLQTLLDLAIPGLPKIHDSYTACGNYYNYSKPGISCHPYKLWLAHNTYGFCRTYIHW